MCFNILKKFFSMKICKNSIQHQSRIRWLKFEVGFSQYIEPHNKVCFTYRKITSYIMYNSADFDKLMQLCNHRYSQDIKQFHHPRSSCSRYWSRFLPSVSAVDKHWCVFCPYSFWGFFPQCCINEVIQDVAFWVWVLSVSIMQLSSSILLCVSLVLLSNS